MADHKSRLIAAALAALALWCAPGASAWAAPKAAATQADDGIEITFIGYRALPGGRGLLFVELSDSLVVDVSRAGPVIEYKMRGARVPLKNNRNPLLLRDFSSSALMAVLVPSKPEKGARKGKPARGEQSVRLVVTLRGNVTPTHRIVMRGKSAVLEIELPAPTG
jgi:hypothetical protein